MPTKSIPAMPAGLCGEERAGGGRGEDGAGVKARTVNGHLSTTDIGQFSKMSPLV